MSQKAHEERYEHAHGYEHGHRYDDRGHRRSDDRGHRYNDHGHRYDHGHMTPLRRRIVQGDTPPPPRPRRRHLSPMQAHLVAASGEFAGTFLFLFMAYSGHLMVLDQLTSPVPTPGPTKVLSISFAYGFSLLVTVWAFYRISGGLFNPAVTWGMCLAGQLPWMRGLFLFPTQIISSMCAAAVVQVMFPGGVDSLNTTLSPGVSIAQGLFAEMFFTSYLIFVVLMLAAEKSRDTFLAPIGIGLALFVAEIPGVYYTGGSLNPARSFGCALVSLTFPGYHWVYWAGPAMGGVLAAAYYRFVKFCHYEEANPGQDATDDEQV